MPSMWDARSCIYPSGIKRRRSRPRRGGCAPKSPSPPFPSPSLFFFPENKTDRFAIGFSKFAARRICALSNHRGSQDRVSKKNFAGFQNRGCTLE